MHRPSKAELGIYAVVVLASTVLVFKEAASFSARADTAILQALNTTYLTTPVSHILHLSHGYVERLDPDLLHKLRQLDPRLSQDDHTFPSSLAAAQNVPVLGHAIRTLKAYLDLPRDTSDDQWRDFRSSLGLLAAGMAAYVSISGLARRQGVTTWKSVSLVTALVVLGVLHGSHAVWPVLLALGSFQLSQSLAGRRHGLLVMWAVQLAVFVFIRYHNGVRYSALSPQLAWLDQHRGLLRWYIHYNFVLLRMLSFFTDLHWARAAHLTPGSTVKATDAKAHQLPIGTTRSLSWYLLYVFYPPLYIAGPIMAYKDWATQVTSTAPRVTRKQVLTYAARWLLALFLLDLATRTLHFNALAKYTLLTRRVLQYHGVAVRPMHYAYTGFWVLVFMWLKFLVIWRFFRLVSLADGVDPPENMRRCVCDNYDIQGFWQGWHASYNRWLVRYLYVPLGGSAWMWLNIWPIFGFVALWHDLDLRMLSWSVVMPAAFIPELAVKRLGRSRFLAPYAQTVWYRQVAGLLGAANVLALMSANLVGFVVGVDGILPLLQQVLGEPWTALMVVGVISSAVQLMFEWRVVERHWTHKERAHAS